MNPLLPRDFFMPDAEARVMPDGKLYLYGSQDLSGSREYCSKTYHVFGTEDPTLSDWKDCGVSFENTTEHPGIPWSPDTILYAPDCVHKDGKYYLYICGSNKFEGVAVSDSPAGPFTDAKRIEGADGVSIDPSVFVDDDGQAYYFWGQAYLKGAKLNPDMVSLDMSTLKDGILSEMEHGFHEGASIRKRGGKYYMVYTDISRGRATCMSYAVADHPLGPYKKGGVIVDNTGCDPLSWNDHGSIEEYKGQWYVFYHRSSQNSNTSRRVCVEPITFLADGSIPEVEMTSQGASGPINAFAPVDASLACRMHGRIYIAPSPDTDGATSREILTNAFGSDFVEDWAEYKYLDFSTGASACSVRARGKGTISVKVEDYGVVGQVKVDSKEFVSLDTALSETVRGTKAVWLLFLGENLEADHFTFK